MEFNREQVILLGDTHSLHINRYLAETILPENSIIIHVGDGGESESWEKDCHELLDDTNNSLLNKNSILLIQRGNHSHPIWFVKDSVFNRSNIIFVPDYSVIKINNKDCLFVGGAVSIDRTMRTEGTSYWKDEGFIYDAAKIDFINKNYNIFALFSHSLPENHHPVGINRFVSSFFKDDPGLERELAVERHKLRELYEEFPNVKISAAGHFHLSYIEIFDTRTHFTLNIEELKNITNYFNE